MKRVNILIGVTLALLVITQRADVLLWAKDDDGKDAKQDDKKNDKNAKNGDDKKSDDKKSDDDSHAWVTVKTFSGSTTGKEKDLKFQTTTKTWRVTYETTHVGSGETGHVRGAVMVETARDQNDKPQNWKQVDVLFDGDAGLHGNKTFNDGVDEEGKSKWFMIALSGVGAKYNVVVEDQGEKRGKGK